MLDGISTKKERSVWNCQWIKDLLTLASIAKNLALIVYSLGLLSPNTVKFWSNRLSSFPFHQESESEVHLSTQSPSCEIRETCHTIDLKLSFSTQIRELLEKIEQKFKKLNFGKVWECHLWEKSMSFNNDYNTFETKLTLLYPGHLYFWSHNNLFWRIIKNLFLISLQHLIQRCWFGIN